MQHFFDISIAKKYDVNVAIFLNNLAFWIKNNVANRTNFHDDNFWTFNSQPALLIHFPYWSQQTLKTTIKHCIENDLIIIGNFNKKKYDKTSWYALTEKGLSLYNCLKDELIIARNEKNSNKINIGENQPMHRLKSTDGQVKINRPIPDNNPDIKTHIKESTVRKKLEPLSDDFKPDAEAENLAKERGLDITKILFKFRHHAKSQGWKRENWQSALLKWIVDEKIEQKKQLHEAYSAVNKMKEHVSEKNIIRN